MDAAEQAALTYAHTQHFDQVVELWQRKGRFIPESVVGGLRRYVVNRIPTGGFLRAVLENDLMEAMGRADDLNREYLDNIVQFCNEALPWVCWGSQAKCNEWLYSTEEGEDESALNDDTPDLDGMPILPELLEWVGRNLADPS